MAKRPRTDTDDPNSKTMLTALTAAKGVCGVDLKVGMRLQVRWSVIADEEEEGENADAKAEGDAAEGEESKGDAKLAADSTPPDEADSQKGEEGHNSSAPVVEEHKDKDEAGEEEDYVWWGCHLDSLKTDMGPYGPIWVLKYDAMTVRDSSHSSFPSPPLPSPTRPPPQHHNTHGVQIISPMLSIAVGDARSRRRTRE